MRLLSFIFTLLMAFGSPGLAQTAVTLGVGRLFTNDYLGDGHDRWQSGSHVVSTVRGPVRWSGGDAPFGALREYRLRGAIMASNGRGPAPGDRPYVGLVSFGVHSHYGTGTTRSSFGVDLTAIGPQTGISDFQQRAHEVLGMPKVRFTGRQMGDDLFLGAIAETAVVMALSDRVTLRPFAEVQAGPEDLIRLGADFVIGEVFKNDIAVRDVTTGHLYEATHRHDAVGFSFLVGADVAVVGDSVYLPNPKATRGRLRAGVHWQSATETHLFYGITYLTPEFAGQDEGQITGSLQLIFNF